MKTDRELLNITRKKLREAKRLINQNEEANKARIETISTMYTKLVEYWYYNPQDQVLINWTIFSFR